jgi:Uma2 family endonuclease
MMANGESGPQRLSREVFYQLLEAGHYRDKRVELIEGEVVVMAAQNNFHAAAIKLTEDALNLAFGSGYWVRVQNSLDLTPWSVVDPDLAVIVGSPRGVSRTNPTSALLVVEVSETTLATDHRSKGSLYAIAGITDYWIVNLVDWQLEIYRNPGPAPAQPFGGGYALQTTHGLSDQVVPLALPQTQVLVADLFP